MGLADDPIKVTGLREFQAALKAADGESQKQLRVVLNNAAELVAVGARRRVPVKTGRARASIKVMSSQREAKVQGGSKKVPYYGWLDFGGRIGREQSIRRPVVPGGRYLYPAYSSSREEVHRALAAGLVDLAKNVGLEVT